MIKEDIRFLVGLQESVGFKPFELSAGGADREVEFLGESPQVEPLGRISQEMLKERAPNAR